MDLEDKELDFSQLFVNEAPSYSVPGCQWATMTELSGNEQLHSTPVTSDTNVHNSYSNKIPIKDELDDHSLFAANPLLSSDTFKYNEPTDNIGTKSNQNFTSMSKNKNFVNNIYRSDSHKLLHDRNNVSDVSGAQNKVGFSSNKKNLNGRLSQFLKSQSAHPYNISQNAKTHQRQNLAKSVENKSNDLKGQLSQARSELKNLRESVKGLKFEHKKDVLRLENLLNYKNCAKKQDGYSNAQISNSADAKSSKAESNVTISPLFHNWKPIGYMESPFMHKNGTSRQGCLVKESKGKIRILDALYTNPQHSLQGLEEYSHVWIIFAFDRNSDSSEKVFSKAKVSPPRLGGSRLGVFATRSPHRPNPIGLTLAKLEGVDGATVYVSGIDILYGTAILDIKPYIPQYDRPQPLREITRESLLKDFGLHRKLSFETSEMEVTSESASAGNKNNEHVESFNEQIISVSKGITKSKLILSPEEHTKLMDSFPGEDLLVTPVKVSRIPTSEQLKNAEMEADSLVNLADFETNGVNTAKWMEEANKAHLPQVIFSVTAEQQLNQLISDVAERDSARALIRNTLCCDPRSVYRRNRCPDMLYRCSIAGLDVTTVFLDDEHSFEVLRISLSKLVDRRELEQCVNQE